MFNPMNVLRSRILRSGLIAAVVVASGALAADTGDSKPLQLAQLTEGFNAEQAYMQGCFACHNSGAGGAPKLEDTADWNARMEKGMDAVMANVINGMNAMPAKGLCFTCTDEDLRAIVDYMLATAQSQ